MAGFDADLKSNASETLTRLERFNPDVAILAFGAGVAPGAGMREVVLTNMVYPVEVASWLHERTGCRCLIQIGSCFEYGEAAAGAACSEEMVPRPFNTYGLSKLGSCLSLERFAAVSEMQVLYLRPFTVFGPGESQGRLSPTVLEAALTGGVAHFSDGDQERDFVYVRDLADFTSRLLEARARVGRWEIFNVCSGRGMRIREFVRRACAVLDERFGRRPGAVYFDIERKWKNEPDILIGVPSKARALLDWTCRWELEEAIADYFEEYRRERAGSAEVASR